MEILEIIMVGIFQLILMIIMVTYFKKFKDTKRQDVLANYKAAERIGRNRLKRCKETGVLFQYSYFKKIMDIFPYKLGGRSKGFKTI